MKTKAGMTRLFWYEVETNKLMALGYSQGEAHKIVMNRFLSMSSIEWKDESDEDTS
jgi:uncharacterized protein YoaH (UPF0181 family)